MSNTDTSNQHPLNRYQYLFYLSIYYYLVMTITRIILFTRTPGTALFHLSEYISTFLVGFVYDTAFLMYLLAPLSCLILLPSEQWIQRRWVKRSLHCLYFSLLFGLGFIAISEILFWDEFQARFNFIAIDYLIYRREVSNNIVESYPVLTYLSICLLFAGIFYALTKDKISQHFSTAIRLKSRLITTATFLLSSVLVCLLLDQSLMHENHNSRVNELSGNGPYQFVAAFRNNQLDYQQFYISGDDNKISSLLKKTLSAEGNDGLFDIRRNIQDDGAEKHLNVILIMVESLSADYLGIFGNPDQLTPHLDELSQSSLLFTQLYATGTRTVRGLEAVTLSIPPTPGRSIVKRIGRESNMTSFGQILKDKGYDVKFLYGGHGYFDNMNRFFKGNGYDIVDEGTIPKKDVGFKNAWGIADEYLFNQAIKEANQSHQNNQPFFFHIMTTSNHRPYSFPEGRVDAVQGKRHSVVKYTDWAIGDFIKNSQNMPWFEDTVFVIVADHTSGSSGKTKLDVDKYHIPLIIYSPKHVQPDVIDTVSSQIDVPVTVLSLLNMSYPSVFFGQDILSMTKSESRAFIGNYQHLGLYQNNQLIFLSPQKKVTLIENPHHPNPNFLTGDDIKPTALNQLLMYYQGADYIYQHQLNRHPHLSQPH